MFLKVFQIYYKEEQRALLEPEYIPYLNQNCTVFFENSVILDLYINGNITDCEYFGVVSYKLREKIGSVMKERWSSIPQIANHSLTEFTPALFENELRVNTPDVMSFQRHLPHDPISLANRFHPNFSEYFKKIMLAIGYDWNPTHFNDVFYCNYFVAKTDIYRNYLGEMLFPAMTVMGEMPELMFNSRYPHPLPEDLKLKFGIPHYPYHAFLAERMFSYYVWLKKLKCIHY